MLALGYGQSTHRPYWYLLAAGLGAGILALLSLDPNVEPSWILVAVASIPVLVICMLKFPAAFIVPVIFVSQVKDWPAVVPLQRQIDLTFFFLVLLSITVLLSLLFGSVGQAGWPVRRLLAGQGQGVAAFLMLATIVAVSYLYSPAPNYGWQVVSRLSGIGGLLFLSPLILVRREKDLRHFVGTFLFAAVALAIGMVARLESSAPGGTKDITHIGAGWLMGMAVLLALYYRRLFERRLPQSLVMLFYLPVLVVGLLASVSRGPILSLVPVLVITSLLLNARQQLVPRIVKILGVLAFLLASYVAFSSFIQGIPELREKYANKTTELEQLWQGEQTAHSGGQRLGLYESALQSMSERPFFGLGVGGWSVYRYGREANRLDPTVEADPHNLFLQVGAEEGVVGLIALFAFLGTVVSAIRRIFDATGNRFLVLPGLLMFVVSTSMFSGDLDDDRIVWMLCGVIFAISRMVRERRAIDPPIASQPSPKSALSSA